MTAQVLLMLLLLMLTREGEVKGWNMSFHWEATLTTLTLKDSYGKVVAEETGEREKLKKKDSRKTKWQQIKYNDRSTKY